MIQTQDESETHKVHPYSIAARKTLDNLISSNQIKAEWLAVVCGMTPQLLSKYRTGVSPIPMHVCAIIDNALETPAFLTLMASMEGRELAS